MRARPKNCRLRLRLTDSSILQFLGRAPLASRTRNRGGLEGGTPRHQVCQGILEQVQYGVALVIPPKRLQANRDTEG